MGGGSSASGPTGTAAGAVDGWAKRMLTGRDASRICGQAAKPSLERALVGAVGGLALTVSRETS